MVESIVFMLGLGAVCGGVLSFASKIFYVYEDPKIAEVEANLAGANCGGCGYAGCSAAANAVVSGEAPPSVCVISSADAVMQVASIMGVDPGVAEPMRSYHTCNGGNRAEDQFYYSGIDSCAAMHFLFAGKKECIIGCLGLGDCIKACNFNAINMGKDGYPVVDEDKCVGCGACSKTCPQPIIEVKTMSEKLFSFNRIDGAHAPCAQRCPAQINIPQYISQIKNGDYKGAVYTIKERNPLPLTCGRVCPKPCEDLCRRGIEDQPVSINKLKRFVSDKEMTSNDRYPIKCAPDTGKKVAVIGGGPASLSAAYFLRRVGHAVSMFDSMPKLGGMVRYGIPEYRLPKEVLDWEIQGIIKLGVKVYSNLTLGKDFNIGSLIAADYDAILLGVGAWKDFKMGIEGEDLEGSYTGITFLTQFAKYQQNVPKIEKPYIGKKCVIVGGGNTAIDCARTLIRLDTEEVSIVYRRTEKEMPANKVEIKAAKEEGINFVFLANPVKVVGNEEGKVSGLEYIKMELGEPDKSGRRRPVPIEGSNTIMEADMFITAIGQSPDTFFKDEHKKLREDLYLTRWNTIDSELFSLQSSIPYIFVAGDAATGAATVVEAIGGGRRAARSIDLYLKDKALEEDEKELITGKFIPGTIFDSVAGVQKRKRIPMPELEAKERVNSFDEVDLVISQEEAAYESKRCLSCCRICYNKEC